MNRADRFIASCSSWEDFCQQAARLSDADKGRVFERLTQIYLQTAPEYQTILRQRLDVTRVSFKQIATPRPSDG